MPPMYQMSFNLVGFLVEMESSSPTVMLVSKMFDSKYYREHVGFSGKRGRWEGRKERAFLPS